MKAKEDLTLQSRQKRPTPRCYLSFIICISLWVIVLSNCSEGYKRGTGQEILEEVSEDHGSEKNQMFLSITVNANISYQI